MTEGGGRQKQMDLRGVREPGQGTWFWTGSRGEEEFSRLGCSVGSESHALKGLRKSLVWAL